MHWRPAAMLVRAAMARAASAQQLTKSSILTGGRECHWQGDYSAPAELAQKISLRVLAGVVPADRLVKTASDEQPLSGLGSPAKCGDKQTQKFRKARTLKGSGVPAEYRGLGAI